MGSKTRKSNLKVFSCHGLGGNQYFVLSKRGEIIFNDEVCLDFSSDNKLDRVELWECHGLKGNQEWKHSRKTGHIQHAITGRCLDVDESNGFLTARYCNMDGKITTQQWRFANYDKKIWYLKFHVFIYFGCE